jgi:hypothetical protein
MSWNPKLGIVKEEQQILEEISALTNIIESDYPELYQFLDENPITIPSSVHPDLNKKTLEVYLQDLKDLLKHHVKTHTTKKS